jgi:hypothetical protein
MCRYVVDIMCRYVYLGPSGPKVVLNKKLNFN